MDISDLDLCLLIKALLKYMNRLSFHKISGIELSSDDDDAYNEDVLDQCILDALSESKYIDYIAGYRIKTNFSDLNTQSYNQNAGDNAFENIVAKLR